MARPQHEEKGKIDQTSHTISIAQYTHMYALQYFHYWMMHDPHVVEDCATVPLSPDAPDKAGNVICKSTDNHASTYHTMKGA
jgi:hypothetical protein